MTRHMGLSLVAHTRCRRLRTHGVASAGTAPTSPFADAEDVSYGCSAQQEVAPRQTRCERSDAHRAVGVLQQDGLATVIPDLFWRTTDLIAFAIRRSM